MKYLTCIGVGLAIFFILLNVDMPNLKNITGASIVKDNTESEQTYAYNLDNSIMNFFNVNRIIFPENTCADVARDMYIDLAYKDVDTINGFDSKGEQKIASLNFVTDRLRRYGTVDLIKGIDLLKDYSFDTKISFNVESYVAVPKEDRSNFFSMDLMGIQEGSTIYIYHGRYSTPSFDCAFIYHDNETLCSCETHPIQDIEVAGITASIPSEEAYVKIKNKFGITDLEPLPIVSQY